MKIVDDVLITKTHESLKASYLMQGNKEISIAAYSVELNHKDGLLVDGTRLKPPLEVQVLSLRSGVPIHIRAIYDDMPICEEIPELKDQELTALNIFTIRLMMNYESVREST